MTGLRLPLRARTAALVTGPVTALAVALAVTVGADRRAEAAPLARSEASRLARGETVVRSETLAQGAHRYVGGITYTVVDAKSADLDALFDDVASWRKVLPRTKRARLVPAPEVQVGEAAHDSFVEITQGTSLVSAEYTLRVRRQGGELRFWLDPSLPHDIDDAWGFFRASPFTNEAGEPRLLLTYGILVDVGPGIVRDLFEEKVRAAMLSVPQLLRRHVAEQRRAASAR
jgi:hypothetical protein